MPIYFGKSASFDVQVCSTHYKSTCQQSILHLVLLVVITNRQKGAAILSRAGKANTKMSLSYTLEGCILKNESCSSMRSHFVSFEMSLKTF